MKFDRQQCWSSFARFAAGLCLGLTIGALGAAEPFQPPRPLPTTAATRPLGHVPTSPIQNAGLSIPDDEPTDWMQDIADDSVDEGSGILLTDFADPPPAPREFSLEDRLLDLEQRLTEQQHENELFRNRLGLSSSIDLEGNPRTAAVPPPLEDLMFGATAPDKLPAPVTGKKEKEKAWYTTVRLWKFEFGVTVYQSKAFVEK